MAAKDDIDHTIWLFVISCGDLRPHYTARVLAPAYYFVQYYLALHDTTIDTQRLASNVDGVIRDQEHDGPRYVLHCLLSP